MVVSTAEELGIDSTLLVFQWEMQAGMILPEHGIQITDKVHVLKIYLGKSSQALTLTESIMCDILGKPEALTAMLKKSIDRALRKLKQGTPR